MRSATSIRKSLAASAVGALLILTPGCLQVVRHEAPYYVEGPQQVDPPNGFFPAGKHVMVFGEKDTYKRILTFDGIAAYIWNQDLISLSEWNRARQQAEALEE
jgi:hypothetical protein